MRFNDAESLHPVESVVYVRLPDRIQQYPHGFELLDKVFGPEEVKRIQQLQSILQQEEEQQIQQQQQQRVATSVDMQTCDEELCHTAS